MGWAGPPSCAAWSCGACPASNFARNLLSRVPKAAQDVVAPLLRSLFAQPDAEAVWAQHAQVVDQLTARLRTAELLAEAVPDLRSG